MKLKSIFYFAIIILLTACSEEFDFNFDKKKPFLIVEGKITDQNVNHYVRLTQSLTKVVTSSYSGTEQSAAKGISDAKVVVSDNLGNTETLEYIGKKPGSHIEEDGWYAIKNIKGKVGRTYTISIEWKGEKYSASDVMEAVPEIEKVQFRRKHLEAKNEDVDVPLIFFYEPQNTKNYYLIYYSVNGWIGSNRNWAFSILDDTHLEEYINGLEIDDGQSPTGRDFYRMIKKDDKVKVYLESLSPNAYEFYKSIIKQYNNDGGAFTPTPSSPPTNITGKAQGFFIASAVSTKLVVK